MATATKPRRLTHRSNACRFISGRTLASACCWSSASRRGGKSHEGFQWPKSGTVITPYWSVQPDCESGGLFGWPWGLNLGGGKYPDYQADWIVFAASPECVIDLSDKAKAGPTAEVVYYGSWHGAIEFTRVGREAWLKQRFAAARVRTKLARDHAIETRGLPRPRVGGCCLGHGLEWRCLGHGLEVALPRPRVGVALPRPRVGVALPRPRVGVAPPRPRVGVALPRPRVGVALPRPRVGVALPRPRVGVALPRPRVGVALPRPRVRVALPRPRVGVALPRPRVRVALPRPRVGVCCLGHG